MILEIDKDEAMRCCETIKDIIGWWNSELIEIYPEREIADELQPILDMLTKAGAF